MSQQTGMPANYVRCTAAEGSCPLRETCLRSKVHREANYDSEGEYYGLTVVNLWKESIKPLTTECKAYRKAEPKQFAQGFTRLFDAVPKGVYSTVQSQVEHVFSNRLYYFQCKKGTRLTSPEEQRRIARIFEKNGMTAAPEYDNRYRRLDRTNKTVDIEHFISERFELFEDILQNAFAYKSGCACKSVTYS